MHVDSAFAFLSFSFFFFPRWVFGCCCCFCKFPFLFTISDSRGAHTPPLTRMTNENVTYSFYCLMQMRKDGFLSLMSRDHRTLYKRAKLTTRSDTVIMQSLTCIAFMNFFFFVVVEKVVCIPMHKHILSINFNTPSGMPGEVIQQYESIRLKRSI